MTSVPATFDFKTTVSDKRLRGLWRMMRGYRLIYISALIFIGLGAVINTLTYVLLAYYIDDVLGQGIYTPSILLVIALSFVGMALLQGFFTFWGGRLSAQTSEGIVQRLRDYLFDHMQRLSFRYHDKAQTGELIQRSTSDVDAIRRFFADQAVNAGRIVMLFVINFVAIWRLNAGLAVFSVHRHPDRPDRLDLVLQADQQDVRSAPGTRGGRYRRPCRKTSPACAWSRRLRGKITSATNSRKPAGNCFCAARNC